MAQIEASHSCSLIWLSYSVGFRHLSKKWPFMSSYLVGVRSQAMSFPIKSIWSVKDFHRSMRWSSSSCWNSSFILWNVSYSKLVHFERFFSPSRLEIERIYSAIFRTYSNLELPEIHGAVFMFLGSLVSSNLFLFVTGGSDLTNVVFFAQLGFLDTCTV